MTPALALQDVSWIAPDGKVVLDSFDLAMMPGEATYVEGAAKAGKTVLCSLLMGLTTPIAGHVAFDGTVSGFADHSYVPQTLGLLDDLTVHANIALPVSLARQREDDAWTEEVPPKSRSVNASASASPGQSSVNPRSSSPMNQPRIKMPATPRTSFAC
jgi:ABC-type multidrug transport system ATPase subunit